MWRAFVGWLIGTAIAVTIASHTTNLFYASVLGVAGALGGGLAGLYWYVCSES